MIGHKEAARSGEVCPDGGLDGPRHMQLDVSGLNRALRRPVHSVALE
jgi:hypothetical protein